MIKWQNGKALLLWASENVTILVNHKALAKLTVLNFRNEKQLHQNYLRCYIVIRRNLGSE